MRDTVRPLFVVDDEPQICRLLTRILEREGHVVHAFESPRDALAALDEYEPRLVVTDLMMPGMDGLELVRRIRARVADTRAVLITGYASIDNVVEALRSGVDDFVTKPFSVSEIRSVVDRTLHSRAGRGPDAPTTSVVPSATDAGESDVPETTQLARRLKDMRVTESLHGLLSESFPVRDLVPRASATLEGALGVSHSLLVAPGARDGTFRVRSSSTPQGPWTTGLDLDLGVLVLIQASGTAGVVEPLSVLPLKALLDVGPLAAAPLSRPHDPPEEAAILVVSRRADDGDFDADDLRQLGVAAGALGDVYRALRATERAESAYLTSLEEVVRETEARAPHFHEHSRRVREVALRLGRRVGLSARELELLDVAARLLDVGRICLCDDLLTKDDALSPDELATVRSHAIRSDELIRPVGRLAEIKPLVRHHHENWDGSGYPDGLRGEQIPYLAALARIADAYVALTTPRAWRDALGPRDATRAIADGAGTEFHPELARAFADLEPAGDVDETWTDTLDATATSDGSEPAS